MLPIGSKMGITKEKPSRFVNILPSLFLNPSAYVVKDFPDNQMPKDFGKKLSAGAVNKIVDYLSQLKEGEEPPPIE